MKKGIVITGIILLLLILTNPTPRDFNNFIEANKPNETLYEKMIHKRNPSKGGRVGYYLVASKYRYHDKFYIGLVKNFIEL